MKTKTLALVASGTAAVALAGAVAYGIADKQVHVAVDGSPAPTVHTFGGTVASVLAKDGITLGPHDQVSPAADAPVADGTVVSIAHGRPVTLIVDGHRSVLWTTATTLDEALHQAGISDAARLSVPRSTPLSLAGTNVSATTPKSVSLTQGGSVSGITTTAATVKDVLAEQKLTVGPKDLVTPAPTTPVTNGLSISVQKVSGTTTTTTEKLPHATQRTADASLPKGTTKVATRGVDGVVTKTWSVTLVDGRPSRRTLVSSKVTTQPVTQRELVGSREATSAASTPATSTSTSGKAGAGLDLAREAMWDRIAQCESSGDWSLNDGSGYYGGLQFDKETWLSSGGAVYAPRADLATRAQQITIANKLYAQRGLQPWACAHAA